MKRDPLHGSLIRLRAGEPEDEPFSYEWVNDGEVTRFLGSRYPRSHAAGRTSQAEAEISYSQAGFMVDRLADGRPIGWVALRRATGEDRCATLGISIGDKTCWDGGYGTDTMRTVCRFGFDVMNLNRIELDVYVENARAVRVYEKIGFRLEATLRDYQFKFGQYWDLYLMGLLRGELV
jgi:RimJ/RimL family protein N-acetyltransferase